jgi:hypothetical protein
VRFSDEVSIYSFNAVENRLELEKTGRFDLSFESSKFFIFHQFFLFICGKVLKIYSRNGVFTREFTFGAEVNDASICCTMQGMEAVVLGLDRQLVQAVEEICVSRMHAKLAVIDGERRCSVYDMMMNGSDLLLIEEGVDRAVWNELRDDFVAFSERR